jgi:hypothetical protein
VIFNIKYFIDDDDDDDDDDDNDDFILHTVTMVQNFYTEFHVINSEKDGRGGQGIEVST